MLRGKKRNDEELHAESEAVFRDYGFTDNSGIVGPNYYRGNRIRFCS